MSARPNQRTMGDRSPRTSVRSVTGLLRLAWSRRLECGLTLVAWAARVALTPLVGLPLARVLLGGAAASVVAYAPSRRWLLDHLRHERIEANVVGAVVRSGALGGREVGFESALAVPVGQSLRILVPTGTTVGELERSEELLAVAFGAREVRVRRDPAYAGRALVTVSYRDTLAGAGRPWPWAKAAETNFWHGLPLGLDEDGGTVWLNLVQRHLLVGGEPGAGKSNAIQLVTAAAALDPSVALWLFDGKLVELSAWKQSATCFVGGDATEAIEALRILRREMSARYEAIDAMPGVRQIAPGIGLGLVVVVVDELAMYIHGSSKTSTGFAEALRDLVARGRAAGIIVVAATQKPASDVVPTSLRDLIGYRLALRCATRDASDTVLGGGWATAGYSASDVDAGTRGSGLLLAEGGLPRRLRLFHIDDGALESLASRAASLRAKGTGR